MLNRALPVRHARQANVADYFPRCWGERAYVWRRRPAVRGLPVFCRVPGSHRCGEGMQADTAQAADSYLVQRAREGYLDAYAELVSRHGALAYRVALRLLGNHHDAEDVAQDALVLAWQQLPGFKGDSSFPTWLYRIVTRRALNRIARTPAAASLDLLSDVPDSGAEPARDVERALTADAVSAAVASLPAPQRVAIVLHHFEGLANEEVARITGSTVPAVRSHLFRGRRTLTKTLREWR
jgi:RNA polymerase sigma-70 factor, ECF subfamily